ncbi:MAG TPA: hypothetical protein VKW78_08360 [Terriglobales bacterium]|nr:hypothetical protein [Terriglobales bacterium]
MLLVTCVSSSVALAQVSAGNGSIGVDDSQSNPPVIFNLQPYLDATGAIAINMVEIAEPRVVRKRTVLLAALPARLLPHLRLKEL